MNKLACIALIVLSIASSPYLAAGRVLQQSSSSDITSARTLAITTLDAARAALNGTGNADTILSTASRAADQASDLVDDDDASLQDIAAANALAASSGASSAAVAVLLSQNTSRADAVQTAIVAAQSLIDAIATAPTTESDDEDRIVDAADSAIEASQGAVLAVRAVQSGRVKDAFDEAADVADESKDAAESGAGSTAIRSSETAAYIVLAAGLRYQDNTQAAYSAAVDAGLSAQRAATAAAATTATNGGCASGNIADEAESMTDIVDDDDFDNKNNDNGNDETITEAITAARSLVSRAATACPQSSPPVSGQGVTTTSG